MPLVQSILLILIIVLGTGCSAMNQQNVRSRGLAGEQLVSTGLPALTVQAQMPLRQSFRNSPFIYTAHNFANPDLWGTVYAAEGGDPSAIVILGTSPRGWEWDLTRLPVSAPPDALRSVFFDGQEFTAHTLYLPFENDPFSPILLGEQQPQDQHWRARRFEWLSVDRTVKLLMEYRERVPLFVNRFDTAVEQSQFEQRAEKAFLVTFSAPQRADGVVLENPSWNDFAKRDDFKRLIGNLLLIERMRDRD